MVQINDVNTQRFSLNGVEYFKNFTPIVIGDKITIVNTYDSKLVIVPLTLYSDFEIDAVTYGSVILLQQALLPVIFTRDSLGASGFVPGDYDLVEFQNLDVDPFARISDIPTNNTSFAEKFPMHYLYLLNGGVPNALGETGIVENSSAINGNLAFNTFLIGTNEITCRRYYTNATAGSIANVRNPNFFRVVDGMGFYNELIVHNNDGAPNSAGRMLYGLSNVNNIGNLDPSSMTNNGFGLAADSADTNMQVFFKSPTAGITKVNTGWAKTNSDTFVIIFSREVGSNDISYLIKNVTLNAEISGTFTYTQGTAKLTLYTYKGSGANAIATGYDFIEHKLYTSI